MNLFKLSSGWVNSAVTSDMPSLTILTLALFICIPTPSAWATSVWKVQTPTSHLYLAGTLHILHPAQYPLPAAFEQAYRASSIIVTEVNFDEMNNPETVLSQAHYLLYPSGQSLEQNLNEKTRKRLASKLKVYGASPALINQMKPSLAATTIAMMAFNAKGITAPGVDDHFFKRAKNDNKKMESLETLATQFKAIASFDYFDPNDVINSTLDEITDAETAFNEMTKAWRSGDMSSLNDIFIAPMKKEFPGAYQAILADRNQLWITKLRGYLATPPTELILVGTAHMVGPDGLIAKLEADGFTVTQINQQ